MPVWLVRAMYFSGSLDPWWVHIPIHSMVVFPLGLYPHCICCIPVWSGGWYPGVPSQRDHPFLCYVLYHSWSAMFFGLPPIFCPSFLSSMTSQFGLSLFWEWIVFVIPAIFFIVFFPFYVPTHCVTAQRVLARMRLDWTAQSHSDILWILGTWWGILWFF